MDVLATRVHEGSRLELKKLHNGHIMDNKTLKITVCVIKSTDESKWHHTREKK